MPFTVNGIGTQYYGKSAVERRVGQCHSCGREAELVSYDTRLCFCVIFIPLIPLGKKRVIDDCSACRRHYLLGQSDWDRLRSEAIGEARAEHNADPSDPGKAVTLHATLASNGEPAEAEAVFEKLSREFADDADVQLYLGNVLEEAGDPERSNDRFHEAYRLAPDNPMSQYASAVALAREGRSHAALERLDKFDRSGNAADPALLFSLAIEFDKRLQPEPAAKMLRRIQEIEPSIRKDATFRKLARKVEQDLGEPRGAIAREPLRWERPSFWWSLAAAVVAAVAVGYDLYTTANQKAFVVNGLPVPISVAIDGAEPNSIAPGRWRRFTLGVGDHAALVSQPGALAGEVPFEVSPGRFDRWFRQPVTVVDPTQSAVVLYEETVYRDRPVDSEQPLEYSVAEVCRTFDHVDYHFAEFPQQLEVRASAKETRKSRVGIIDVAPESFSAVVAEHQTSPAVMDLIEHHLLAAESREDLLSAYSHAVVIGDQLSRAVKFLEGGLDRQPVDVHWHRYYQNFAEQAGADDLHARYDAYLAQAPNDPIRLYLRARLANYADRSGPLYDRALAGDPDNVICLIGRAFSEVSTGEFESADRRLARALEADPGNDRAGALRQALQPALGRGERLEATLWEQMQEPPFNANATNLLLSLAEARGDVELARRADGDFRAKLQEAWPSDPQQLSDWSRIRVHRLEGDFAAARRLASRSNNSSRRVLMQLNNALVEGDIPGATSVAQRFPPNAQARAWLWTCLVATVSSAAEADVYRRNAIEHFAAEGGSSAEMSRLLAAELPPAELANRAMLLEEQHAQKAALLLLLADRVGPDRERLVSLAAKLSQVLDPQQPCLKAALATMR